jgi:hypothetical protein
MELSPRLNGAAPALREGWEVHQAVGMVTVQLDVSLDMAETRLRAYAVAVCRPLIDVARDIVHHRLSLTPETA